MLALELVDEAARRAGRSAIEHTDIERARKLCVLTTHTPVSSGHDQFPLDLAERELLHPCAVLVPSLVAVLTAAEEKAGRPLAEHEVEAILAESAAVAMKASDVLSLERSRGYADIEPELAWQQWQIVRQDEPTW